MTGRSPTLLRWLSPDSPWQLALGFTLWSVWFVVVYGGVSVACSKRWFAGAAGSGTAASAALMGVTALTIVLLALAAVRCLRHAHALRGLDPAGPRRPARPDDAVGQAEGDDPPGGVPDSAFAQRRERRRFIAALSAVLHGVAAVSTLFVALPLLWLPPCL
ncbi:hypothetical protein [uncultured Pseudacidovorax sp.]|uniref:hypothetical protein n=1 Tax=uncultured Pseudacidovorax sp. TaxID=679313 RepID=UPI0025EF8397|nr:hypothetical protein [uncultured Pseudacidovorax sp.]